MGHGFAPADASNPEGVLAAALPEEKLAWAAALGVPAFVRRANAVEEALRRLHDGIRAERSSRLRSLQPLARDLIALMSAGAPLAAGMVDSLAALAADPSFRPWPPGKPAPSPRRARIQGERLRRRIAEFNARWVGYLASVPIGDVRSLQSGYNRWFPLERELALRGARMPFTPLRLLEREDLIRMHPGLPPGEAAP